MRLVKLSGAAILAAAVIFTGCSDENNPISTAIDQEQKVSFDYSLSAAFSQRVYNNLPPTESRAAENVKAMMLITDENTGVSDTVAWYVTIDNEVATITSNMTSALTPSVYSFRLSIEHESYRYLGEANNIEINDMDQKDIQLRVKPVIGESYINLNKTELPSLKFQYNKDDISTFADPKIGYTVDGGVEQLVELNPDGVGDVYLNVSEGSHKISLRLLDGNVQKAKSDITQENVVIVPNGNFTIDLIPLSGEVTVSIPVDKSEAAFRFNIPSDVVTEVGGLSNLKAVFQLTSSKNPNLSSEVTFTQMGVSYSGSVTLPSVAYDTVALSLTFMDKSNNDQIVGSMLYDNVGLNQWGNYVSGNLELVNRSVITGDLLSTVVVNVFNQAGSPVQGAKIYVNNELVGITGQPGAFGTEGYLKFNHKKGNVTISAVEPVTGLNVSEVINIGLLDVHTLNLSNDSLTTQTGGLYAITSLIQAGGQGSTILPNINEYVSRLENLIEVMSV